jgi:hypothetical protein
VDFLFFFNFDMCFDDMIRVCLERDTGTKISKEVDAWRYINGTAFFFLFFFLYFMFTTFPPKKSSFCLRILRQGSAFQYPSPFYPVVSGMLAFGFLK